MLEGKNIGEVQESLTKEIEKSQETLYPSSGLVHISEFLKESVTNTYEKADQRRYDKRKKTDRIYLQIPF